MDTDKNDVHIALVLDFLVATEQQIRKVSISTIVCFG